MGTDINNLTRKLFDEFTIAIEYNGSNPVYIGYSLPGTTKDIAKWKISKITYDISGNPTDIQWANGTSEFDKTWNNRTIYIYS